MADKETLYEITGQMLQLQEMAENEDIDAETLADTMESLGYDLAQKADDYGRVIRNLEAEAKVATAKYDAFVDEARRYKDDADRKTNNAKRVKEALKIAITRLHESGALKDTKVAGDTFKFSVAKNGGVKPLKLDVQPESLPEEFQKVTITADTDAIRAFLDENDGAAPFAHYEERGTRLDMRLK